MIQQHCLMCQQTASMAAAPARWACACGITYIAQVGDDGLVSVCWQQGGRGDLLLAVSIDAIIPRPVQVAPLKRGRPAKGAR